MTVPPKVVFLDEQMLWTVAGRSPKNGPRMSDRVPCLTNEAQEQRAYFLSVVSAKCEKCPCLRMLLPHINYRTLWSVVVSFVAKVVSHLFLIWRACQVANAVAHCLACRNIVSVCMDTVEVHPVAWGAGFVVGHD